MLGLKQMQGKRIGSDLFLHVLVQCQYTEVRLFNACFHLKAIKTGEKKLKEAATHEFCVEASRISEITKSH